MLNRLALRAGVARMSGVFFLYFTACVSSAPDTCETQRLPLEVADAESCLVVAQPNLARWVEGHPTYRITAWRCGSPPRGASTRI
ncbi:hypothetical protein GCM10007887_19700 [Methylobacterium haplocladii]|uniref:Uncharacterized protein n=2 Tax=Methylobacterium haplocladii TaxID=1176176 RepID=A0A512ISW2_9HYPH|nr:hypothetical protein MHA02_31890 [Methylobacterium haplocladii]GLS59304.1 hypothetical protein GCM10007887_19700 [Methylobacterium haplocladii]